MKNKLQNYFPIIRTRGEVLEELRENKEFYIRDVGTESESIKGTAK